MGLRIHIIGGPGSSKSFLASLIGARCGLPTVDLDSLFWEQSADRYGVRARPEDRDARLRQVVAGDRWIIEGVYYSWLDPSFERADLVVILGATRSRRHYRIIRRFLNRKMRLLTTKRESIGDFVRLLAWNQRFDSRNLPEIRAPRRNDMVSR